MDQFSSHPLYKKHSIDSVMSSMWDFYSKKFLVLFIASFVMSLIVQYLSSFINFSGVNITDPTSMIEKFKEFVWPLVGVSVLSFVFSLILHYYIIYNPVDSETSIFTACYKWLKYIIPYLIIVILFAFLGSIAMILGFFVIVIGMFFAALYVGMLYLFVLPILMVEGPNIGNAISRTFVLAHRNFWPNMGWVAVVGLIYLVFSFIFSSLVLLPFSGSFMKVLTHPGEISGILNFTSNPVYIILSALINALIFPVFPILAVILYLNGKAREEDTSVAQPSGDEPQRVRVEDLYAKPLPEENKDNQGK
jgi:hypothetical protein